MLEQVINETDLGNEAMKRNVAFLVSASKQLPTTNKVELLRAIAEGLSQEEAFAVLPAMLARVGSWSVVPHDLFEVLMRVRVAVALEMVLIARDPYDDDAWVYMKRRPDNDPHYAGLLHVPGSILRPNEDVIDVAYRLREKELGFLLPERLMFVDLHMNHDTRGSCLGLIYLGDVGELPEDRTNWYRVKDLDREQLCVHHGMRDGIVDKAEALWRRSVGGNYRSLRL